LDILGVNSDDEIWNALKEVQMKETIENLPGQLDSEVKEST
jgi:ATP-binding cassette subfamily C (CFTR/MRP) protein 4